MITKSDEWNLIALGLREIKRSNEMTKKVMNKIKELELKNAKSKND